MRHDVAMRLLGRAPAPLTALVLAAGVAGCSAPTGTAEADGTVAGSASPSRAPISPRLPPPPAATPTAVVDGFALGTPVAVDFSWTVTVTAVSLDAAAAVLAVAPDATAENGRMVLVDLTASPTPGGVVDDGAAAFSLSTTLDDGTESYGQCDDDYELLAPGLAEPGPDGTVSWQVCLDVPPAAAVPTSVIEVADTSAVLAGGSAVTWSLD